MSGVPSAFQIRYAGCKGVVSLAPDLGHEEKMQVRKSMEKFQSDHKKLEVMQTTKPGLLFRNFVPTIYSVFAQGEDVVGCGLLTGVVRIFLWCDLVRVSL